MHNNLVRWEMYLSALVTKWRKPDVQFTIDFPGPACIRLTAHLMTAKRYMSVMSTDLEYACKVLDLGLTQHYDTGAPFDNDHANS